MSDEKQLSNNEATDVIITQFNDRLNAVEASIKNLPTKENVAEIVDTTLRSFFTQGGTTMKSVIITAALIIGSLITIFGGIKLMLGWVGFTYMK